MRAAASASAAICGGGVWGWGLGVKQTLAVLSVSAVGRKRWAGAEKECRELGRSSLVISWDSRTGDPAGPTLQFHSPSSLLAR